MSDTEKKTEKKESKPKGKVAAILVRGTIGLTPNKKATLKMLRLQVKNSVVILENSPVMLGMLKLVKDYVTWGEVDESTLKDLKEKRKDAQIMLARGKSYDGNDKISKKGIRDVFRLHPPVGGFERGGIKKPFTNGGVLGYRGDKINELIIKMI